MTFSVRDNGRGIATEDMHKVFELFRRAGRQDVPGEGWGWPMCEPWCVAMAGVSGVSLG